MRRWAVEQPPEALERDYDLDERAARNLVEFLGEQQQATRVVPSDRAVVVEVKRVGEIAGVEQLLR